MHTLFSLTSRVVNAYAAGITLTLSGSNAHTRNLMANLGAFLKTKMAKIVLMVVLRPVFLICLPRMTLEHKESEEPGRFQQTEAERAFLNHVIIG